MFRETEIDRFSQNDLVIGIEPTEGVTLQFNTKVPGPRVIIDVLFSGESRDLGSRLPLRGCFY